MLAISQVIVKHIRSRADNMHYMEQPQMVFETEGMTDTGKLRKNNEDSLFWLEKREANTFGAASYGIYLVADGMGGHRGGEIASEIAARTISDSIIAGLKEQSGKFSPSELVKQSIENAHREIYRVAGTQKNLRSMGTTVTAALRLDNHLYLGHVGDSRCYLVRKGHLRQLTQDHSLVAFLLKAGLITPAEAEKHPRRSQIFRCLGIKDRIKVDIVEEVIMEDDRLVFCTDGLTSQVSDKDILKNVIAGKKAGDICQNLINLANIQGGEDNTSMIVVEAKLLRTEDKSASIGKRNIYYE